MTSRIVEFFGSAPLSEASVLNAQNHWCPFVDSDCIKNRRRSLGASSLQVGQSEPVIICPNRLYADRFHILKEIADEAFGIDTELLSALDVEVRRRAGELNGREITVFGKYFGKELGIPTPPGLEEGEGAGSFYIDFILVKAGSDNDPEAFVSVEIQTIDTTNSYADAAAHYAAGQEYHGPWGRDLTNAGLNWENVSKRILPQLIYKGHALRREPMCFKGLFFVVPQAVYQRIKRRVGGRLLEYPQAAGTITFRTYDLGPMAENGTRGLVFGETFTTTVEQIAFAFVSPQNLPAAGVYEEVISQNLRKIARKKTL